MDRLGFESSVLLWPLTYLGAVVMWFYVYGKARAWWYCYHALLLAVCGAHLAIVLTSARELWSLLVVQKAGSLVALPSTRSGFCPLPY